VKIKSFHFRRYRRRFREPLITSHGPITDRTGWILRIEEKSGLIGFGEAPDSLPGFESSHFPDDADSNSLLQIENILRDAAFEPDRFSILKFVSICPASIRSAVRFGFETAVCDLAARLNRLPLSEWLTPGASSKVPVNYLMASPVKEWDRVKREINFAGYQTVKVKVGSGSISEDINTVKELRTVFDKKISIRLDANRAWDYETAMNVLDVLADYDIEYIEEPLREFNIDQLARLREETGVKIALDESLLGINDIGKVLSAKACDVLIIKPAVRGGVFAALGNFYLASGHDCRAVLTSSLETEVGIAAQLHMAAALQGEKTPSGLDTIRLFESSKQSLTKVNDGHLELPLGNGIGDNIGEDIWDSL